MILCQTSGKIRHATRHKAGQALAALKSNRPDGRTRNVYRCHACNGWHFGHPKPRRDS